MPNKYKESLITSSILCSYLAYFPAQAQKAKKNSPRKKFLIYPEIEFSRFNIKKILIFFQKKAFLIFSQKNVFLIFLEMNLFTFNLRWKNKKNPHRENFLYFRKRKPRKSFIFSSKESCSCVSGKGNPEMETLKKLLIF